MTPPRMIYLTYWTLVLAGALAATAIYLDQAPHNPKGVTALACLAVWLGASAIGGIFAYAAARGAK